MTADSVSSTAYLSIDGAGMFVRYRGRGQPVLLLHGGGPGTSGDGWNDLIEAIQSPCRFIVPDYLGFGYSDPPNGEYTLDRIVDDIARLMQNLGREPIPVVGHSMGAAVAVKLAIRHPECVDRLMLIAPGGGLYGLRYQSAGIQQMARVLAQPCRSTVQDLVALMGDRRELYARQVDARLRIMGRSGVMETQRMLQDARSASETGPTQPIAAQLSPSLKKLHLLWGECERFNPFALGEQIHARLPAFAEFFVVPGAGHNVHYDEPGPCARRLERFLMD